MGIKSLFCGFLFFGILSAGLVLYLCPEFYTDLGPPKIQDQYFGRGKIPADPTKFPKDNPAIRNYVVEVQDSVLQDLKQRLSNTRFVEPLDNVEFQYGFHGGYLKEVVTYWKDKYDWKKQEKELNKFSHYITQIEGIDVHFIHQKPIVKNAKLKVYPLLMVHGWPGSIAEFIKILPLLTTERKDRDYVFEVICPSIPGYGFSEAPHQPGFDTIAAARIFSKLMSRLGIEKFYTQGGDWGSEITSSMAILYPERVLGAHLTVVMDKSPKIGLLKYAIGHIYPPLFMNSDEAKKMYPFCEKSKFMLQESGYLHIQATKPDTVGAALSDSPAGLAAYILEKFSTWTDPSFRQLKDGGLLKKFTYDDLLTNVMIYWSTNSIASSMRLYKEAFAQLYSSPLSHRSIKVPVGIAQFPYELMHSPEALIKHHARNIIQYTHMPSGGHFPALEEPKLLSDDIWNFVKVHISLDNKKDTTNNAKKDTTKGVKKDTTKGVKKDTTKDAKKDTTKNVKKDTTKNAKK